MEKIKNPDYWIITILLVVLFVFANDIALAIPLKETYHLQEIELNKYNEFAKNFGIAFQLQDDILDTFGDGSQVGKKIGGDIVQNKKTYLYLKAMELSDNSQQDILIQLYSSKNIGFNPENKIAQVTQIFEAVNVKEYTRQLIEAYKDLAISHLMACKVDENIKQQLIEYITQMIFRDH